MCLVASIVGVLQRERDNNILMQVGFVVLIALAARLQLPPTSLAFSRRRVQPNKSQRMIQQCGA